MLILRTILARRTTTPLLELTIEVAHILKSRTIANLQYRLLAVHQLAYRIAYTLIYYEIAHALVRAQVKEMAERRGRHIRHRRQVLQTYHLCKMLADIRSYYLYPLAVAYHALRPRKHPRGQQAIVRLLAQYMQYLHHYLQAVEPRRHPRQTSETGQHTLYGTIAEADTLLRMGKQSADTREMDIAEYRTVEHRARELYRYLVHLTRLEIIRLLPMVLQARPHQHQLTLPHHRLHSITHHATQTVVVLYEVQLHLAMLVQGIIKTALPPLLNMDKLRVVKQRNLRQRPQSRLTLSHGISSYWLEGAKSTTIYARIIPAQFPCYWLEDTKVQLFYDKSKLFLTFLE